jgi:GGDEF domain-containing protein
LKDHLEHDTELQEELKRMEWGVVRLDGRFVNYINRFGNDVGDDFLQSGGAEITSITDGLVRSYNRRAEVPVPPPQVPVAENRDDQRRQGHSLSYDIICRQGGDEFSLIIRNVSPAQLSLVAGRIQAKLTVSQALERYSQDGVPFIASVGHSHATDFMPEVRGKLSRSRYWEAFKQVNDQADEGQRLTKSRQYEEMWNIAYHSMPADGRPMTVARPDDRKVAEEFLRWTCPDFMEDPMRFLTNSQNGDGPHPQA